MKTSWNDIRETENYVQGSMSKEESLVYQAKVITNLSLRWELYFQKMLQALLKMYHRKKLKKEFETLHHHLFSDPAKKEFQQLIFNIFK